MTYLPGQLPEGDPNMQGRVAFIAQREAAQAETEAQWAALREQSRQQRETEQAALTAARQEAQNRPLSRAEQVSDDIRRAIHGDAPARPTARDEIRAKTRDLIAITRHRSAPVNPVGGN